MPSRDSKRVNLTKNRIDSFACPADKNQEFMWDAGMPGLAVRVTKGSKVFVFQARLNDKTIRTTIGGIPPWDIDEARTEAKRLGLLIDKGLDPRIERSESAKTLAATQTSCVTVGEAWDEYVTARKEDWSEAHLSDHAQAMAEPGQTRKRSKKKTKAGALFALRSEKLQALTAERLEAWIRKEREKRPTVAAKGYRLMRTFLNWCADHPGYRDLVNPQELLTKNLRRNVPKPRPKDDCLQKEQLQAWFGTVQNLSNPVFRAYLQCLLLTGARATEMSELTWDDIDFQWKTMTLRDKVEGDRQIPLTPYVARLLAELRHRKPKKPRRSRTTSNPEQKSPPSPNLWVFSSTRSQTGRMGEANHAHTRAVSAAGLPHVTLHGLRRSFGTLAEWVECPVGVVAQIQGHKPSAIAEKHYRRRPIDLLRLWHERIEGWILDEAGLSVASAPNGAAVANEEAANPTTVKFG